ncbi:hypothetical protein [Mumia zhuanghuii]|uniref:Uncharacterized protein n=1 Tax=Mumia zhuanghuii TaxID=2585211 RepID=A0A5C4M8U8_9ACTN|nr:hypothetical protein [Mumia zhuanghuii]TNC30228.1 hypothetical protein FHE65_32945 [Mumia zhuanghuii]
MQLLLVWPPLLAVGPQGVVLVGMPQLQPRLLRSRLSKGRSLRGRWLPLPLPVLLRRRGRLTVRRRGFLPPAGSLGVAQWWRLPCCMLDLVPRQC